MKTYRPFIVLISLFVVSLPIHAEILGPITLGDLEAAGKEQVLIYYANETAPDAREQQNYDIILGWLESSSSETASEVAEKIRRDLREFPKAVDAEIDEIKNRYESMVQKPAGVVFFTNRLAREGRFQYIKSGREEFGTLGLSATDDYTLMSNPLTTQANFSTALKAVAEVFNPRSHVFTLVTKSHGNKDRMFTPRLIVKAEDYDQDQIVAIAEGEVEAGTHRPGLDKKGYFDVIGARPEMLFPLVFVESCQSGPGMPGRADLPANIGRLYVTSDKGTSYRNLDYYQIMNNADLASSFHTTLASKVPQEAYEKAAKASQKKYFYFFPLILTLLWGGWMLIRKSKTTPSTVVAPSEQQVRRET